MQPLILLISVQFTKVIYHIYHFKLLPCRSEMHGMGKWVSGSTATADGLVQLLLTFRNHFFSLKFEVSITLPTNLFNKEGAVACIAHIIHYL